MEPEESLEERLERLRRATRAVGARRDFTSRVMARIQAEVSWYDVLQREARRLVPVAALTAVAALGVAWWSSHDVVDILAMLDEPAELEW